jgi:hypothetical protein
VTQRRVLATRIVSALLQDLARSEILTSDEWRLVRHLFDEQLRERWIDLVDAILAEGRRAPAARAGNTEQAEEDSAGD